MATLTIRNLPDHVVERLKRLAARNGHSMEEQVRRLLTERVLDRASALEQIDQTVATQTRSTTAEEVDAAIGQGRR